MSKLVLDEERIIFLKISQPSLLEDFNRHIEEISLSFLNEEILFLLFKVVKYSICWQFLFQTYPQAFVMIWTF